MQYADASDKLARYRLQIAEVRGKMRELQQSVEPEEVRDYEFWTTEGEVRLSELFGDKEYLFVIHNMGAGCPNCTLWADGFNGILPHIENRAAFVVVSPDEPAAQQRFRTARGWRFRLVSYLGTGFAHDMGLSQRQWLGTAIQAPMTLEGIMQSHKVVSHEDWLTARRQLLADEKEFTHLRDRLSQQRRDLPWERVDKDYVFDGPNGRETLSQLFDGKHQLAVYHFMLGPGWNEGCKSCSYWADNFNGIDMHLRQRDVSFLAISRAPWPEIEAFKRRMEWTFKWVSSFGTDFNYDYQVSAGPEQLASGEVVYNYAPSKMTIEERPGISVFYKDDDVRIFHTYSCYARGLDMLNGAYHWLDLVPKGRDEAGPPNTHKMTWVRLHDEYEQ